MSEMAKKAREAMKAKAKSLSSADPSKKVDSSTWTPPEPLNTEAKTGLRPVSRRAFKKGGKVMGENSKCDMGRKPRQSGGSAKAYAIAKINRNVKEANEERPGIKHVGGMKKGGRAHKQNGGGADEIGRMIEEQALSRAPAAAAKGLNPSPSTASTVYDKVEKDALSRAPAAAAKGLTPKPAPAIEKGTAGRSPQPSPENMPVSPEQESRMRSIMNTQRAADRAQEQKENMKRDFGVTNRKHGGKAHKMGGGGLKFHGDPVIPGMKKGGKAKHADEKMDIALIKKMTKPEARKGKAGGGFLKDVASDFAKDETKQFLKSKLDDAMGNSAARGMSNFKKGGKAHPDEKMDKALIKKMVKSSARTGKDVGGALGGLLTSKAMEKDSPFAGVIPMLMNKKAGGRTARKGRATGGASLMDAANRGKYNGPYESINDSENSVRQVLENAGQSGAAMDQEMYRDPSPTLLKILERQRSRTARKEGGGVFSGPGYPGKVPGVTGGRIARKAGGKAKGKTNINIVIAAGKPADGADMMGAAGPMGGPTRPPGGMPVPVPPPQGAPPMPPAAMPMPMPMPQAPAGGPPVPRKSGGRLTAKASSYKDMTAGAGSGEGRLQKTDIAKARMGRKAGGKTYRSYKDMDAGSGSGLGRLEKTEIQAHKR